MGEYPTWLLAPYAQFALGPASVQYNFTIMVPVAIFNQLVYPASGYGAGHTENWQTHNPPQATDVTRNGSIIRALVDKFNAVGMLYNITTY